MAKKKQLILIVSDLMNNNKKQNRQEHQLVRMSKNAREFMGFGNDKVELYPSDIDASKRLKGAMLLDIYKAYSEDLKALKERDFSKEELRRVGFVTEATFKKIVSNDNENNVWISNDINDTVIGADPEFIFKNYENEIIHANSLLSFDGILGSDGAMAEIRPFPSITPKRFINTITDIFANGTKKNNIKHLQWLSGCFYQTEHRSYPIGGHIHIGTPIQVVNNFCGRDLSRFFYCLNKILDEMMGVPLVKLDGVTNAKRRRSKYGYFGEFRSVNNRLEYRSLSGVWLTHPKLAEAVIGTIKAIVSEVYKHIMNNKLETSYVAHPKVAAVGDVYLPEFDGWECIGLTKDMECTCSTGELKTKINKPCNNDITITHIKKWYQKMRNLSSYNDYAEYIDLLYDTLLMPLSRFNKFDKNLQHNWLEGAPFAPIKK